MKLTSIIVHTTISRRTITIIQKNTRTRIRIGSITRNTVRVPNTGISQQLRSLGSKVPGPGLGQGHQTPGATAKVQATEVVEALKPAIAAVTEAVRMP
jgi:hypothetical protein